ncbi:MAG: porin family protein [Acidobacteriota bacterium]|nr:porin family protein [Acidobacteriota bacterium]
MTSSSNYKQNENHAGRFEARIRSVAIQGMVVLWLAIIAGLQLNAQAIPTASSPGRLQIGGAFNLATGNAYFGSNRLTGGGGYATFDFKYRYGIEVAFHQLTDLSSSTVLYERTYEVGPRYVRRYGRLAPYGKLMYGRGVFNFPVLLAPGVPTNIPAANLAYNLGALGAGLDYRFTRSVNLRADYEVQRWFSFPTSMTPNVVGFGIAYQFN